jgi:nicotinamidase/pyrazinamidase
VFTGTIAGCQDWHPIEPQPHGSFAKMLNVNPFTETTLNGTKQVAWPVHCVQNSRGAEYVPTLDQSRLQFIVKKGLNRLVDSYSGSADVDGKKTILTELLKKKKITDVYVDGLAFDYCVGYTALDLKKEGFNVTVIEDATRSVDAGSQAAMKANLLQNGIRIVNSTDLIGKDPFFPAPAPTVSV